MLYIIMQFDISVRLTLQVTTITCHHIKKNTKIWGTRPKLIC